MREKAGTGNQNPRQGADITQPQPPSGEKEIPRKASQTNSKLWGGNDSPVNSFRPTLSLTSAATWMKKQRQRCSQLVARAMSCQPHRAHIRTIKLAMDDRWDEALNRNVNGNAD